MDLSGRKLLLMGGTAYLQSLKKYLLEKGFQMIGVGKNIIPYKNICDRNYCVDTQDVDSVVKVVDKEKCDGVFVGASEVNIIPAMEVARCTGIHFYTDKSVWDVLANKQTFKKLLSNHGTGIDVSCWNKLIIN